MRAKWRTYKEQIKQAEMPDSMKGTSKLPINYDELISDVLKTSNQIERDRIIRPTASAQQTRRLKPDWAKTEEQIEMERDQEIEEVLDFMENFDPEAVKRDAEVQSIVHALMDRVKQIDNGTATVTREGESHSYNPQFANQNRERSFRLRTEKGPVHAAVPSQDGFGKEIGSRQKVRASTAINHTSQEQPLSQSIKHSHQHHQAKPTASGLDMDLLRAKIVKSLAEAIMKSDPVKERLTLGYGTSTLKGLS
jgi:hypothetical protein